eukprot:933833-Amorphochlora_amoeboformis.AAC.1
MVFIDLSKAYDTVSRKLLWPLLERYGLPTKLVSLVRSMHEGMQARLRLDTDLSESFPIENGLRQGCVMAPTLFNLFFAAVFYAAFHDLQEEKGIQIVSRLDGRFFAPQMFNARTKTTISSFRDLCYADDCALCAHSQEQLQDFMN